MMNKGLINIKWNDCSLKKKKSLSFISSNGRLALFWELRRELSHCSHLDYFNNVFNNFSRLANFSPSRSLWSSFQIDPAFRFHKKIS